MVCEVRKMISSKVLEAIFGAFREWASWRRIFPPLIQDKDMYQKILQVSADLNIEVRHVKN